MTDEPATAAPGAELADAPPGSAAAVLASLWQRPGAAAALRAHRTGFEPLDRVLEGGVRPHDLVLLGGTPGVGKTIAALQWARQMAVDGCEVVYACYEHDEHALLARLLSLELGMVAGTDDVTELDELRGRIRELAEGRRDPDALFSSSPLLHQAYEAFLAYAGRLRLVRASGTHTDVGQLDQLLPPTGGDRVLFVDYLQKVAVRPEPDAEAEKVTRVAEGLKELALSRELPVVAVVAADAEGLTARRLRLHHLRGSTALAYECDVAVVLNDKHRAVTKAHLAYDPVKAETFRQWVVLSVEKNRGGLAMVDTEHRKDFAHFRLDPEGRHVAERLVDERLDEA